jgi:hypothetical protein
MFTERKDWGPAQYEITRTDGATHTITVKGRVHWALWRLMQARENGCTPIDHPGPRWSAYVHTLRHEYRVEIETIREKHGAPFDGTHARYVAKSEIAPSAVIRASGVAA